MKCKNKGIGYISLVEYNKNKYETHSWLHSKYHGKGIGLLLYAEAIKFCRKKKKSIGSSTHPSTFAQRLWNSKRLKKKFGIKKTNRFMVTK